MQEWRSLKVKLGAVMNALEHHRKDGLENLILPVALVNGGVPSCQYAQ